MRKLALISSYCNTEEKLKILDEACKTLKSLGVDTFVSSPIKIDIDADFLYFTKENPVIRWPEKAISLWRILPYDGKNLKLQPLIDDPGWASLYQIKKLMQFGATFDYDIFYVMIYDLNIDDKIISDIKNNFCNLIYPRRDFTDPSKIFPATLHFSIFDKQKLIELSSLIDYKTYTSFDGFAEDFVERWSDDLRIDRSNHVVTDLINITPKDPFNISESDKYNFFINKDEKQKVKFYLTESNSFLEVIINDTKYEITDFPKLVETNFNFFEINSLIINQNNNSVDYTEIYKKISKNIIEFV